MKSKLDIVLTVGAEMAATVEKGRIEIGMDFEAYKEVDALNASAVKAGSESMLAMKAYLDSPPKETRTMGLGSCVHAFFELGPGGVEEKYTVVPDFAKDPRNHVAPTPKQKKEGNRGDRSTARTKWVKEMEGEWLAANPGKTPISKQDYDHACRMTDAVFFDQKARDYISEYEPEEAEVSVFGDIEGLPCKARLDLWIGNVIVEIKTTSSLAPFAFGRVFRTFHYGIGLEWYRGLATAVGRPPTDIVLIVVSEKNYDVGVRVYTPEEVYEKWSKQTSDIVRRYRIAKEKDHWPGVADGGFYQFPDV